MVGKLVRLSLRVAIVAAIVVPALTFTTQQFVGRQTVQAHSSSNSPAAGGIDVAKTPSANVDLATPNSAPASSSSAAKSPVVRRIAALTPDATRSPGEFEPGGTLILGCNEFQFHPHAILDILAAVSGHMPVIALVSDELNENRVRAGMAMQEIPLGGVEFMNMPLDSMWVRDYGPAFVHRHGRLTILNTQYVEAQRTNDDDAAWCLAVALKLPVTDLRLRIESGNLLSNGAGAGLTSTYLEAWNHDYGYDLQTLSNILNEYYGFQSTAFLAPLTGEPTGHVDMFATFISPQVCVLGQCDPKVDPVNAAILDKDAELISQLSTPDGPVKVARIPMPPHADGYWRTYNNVIYANGTLLVPTYPEDCPELDKQALEIYRKLLPNWHVVGIDSTSLIMKRGSLHCISLNMPFQKQAVADSQK